MNVNRGKMTAAAVLAVTLLVVGGVTGYGSVSYTHLILQSLLNGVDIRNCIHKCLDGDHRQITSALAACDKLTHVFILACEIPVIQIKSTYIDAAFLKGLCHKRQILSGTGCRKSATVDLLVEKELVFAVLFYVIQSFICFGIAVLKLSLIHI